MVIQKFPHACTARMSVPFVHRRLYEVLRSYSKELPIPTRQSAAADLLEAPETVIQQTPTYV